MLSAYIQAAMAHATEERLEASGQYYVEIPELRGVWAAADSPATARRVLQEVLEDWIELGLAAHDQFPVIDGIDINLEHFAGTHH